MKSTIAIKIRGYLPANKTKNTKAGTKTIYLPVLPEKINMINTASFAEYKILELGAVSIPNGNELTTITWEGVLPGSRRSSHPYILDKKWSSPSTIQSYFNYWKTHGIKLYLEITTLPVKKYVYLSEFEMVYDGGFGDYSYKITFKEAKSISIKSSKSKVKSYRPTIRSTKGKGKKYKVKPGDCLWNIALKYYKKGAQYTKIYDANKKVIEAAAKKHGKSSSSHGHWIYAGTILTIP